MDWVKKDNIENYKVESNSRQVFKKDWSKNELIDFLGMSIPFLGVIIGIFICYAVF